MEEEIKKEEENYTEEKSLNSKNNISAKNGKKIGLITTIAILLIIIVCVGGYFLFFKDNINDNTIKYSGVFTSSDGKKIKLKYTANEYFNDGNQNGFEIESGTQKLTMYSPDMSDYDYEIDSLFTIYENFQNWYLLND